MAGRDTMWLILNINTGYKIFGNSCWVSFRIILWWNKRMVEKKKSFLKTWKIKIKHHHRRSACLEVILRGRDPMLKLSSACISYSISWSSYLISLNLSFFICKIGMMPTFFKCSRCSMLVHFLSGLDLFQQFNNFKRWKRPREIINTSTLVCTLLNSKKSLNLVYLSTVPKQGLEFTSRDD